MAAIYKKEVQSYFRNLTGYLFVFFILIVFGLFTFIYCIKNRSSHFEYVYYGTGFLFLIAVPILRSFGDGLSFARLFRAEIMPAV